VKGGSGVATRRKRTPGKTSRKTGVGPQELAVRAKVLSDSVCGCLKKNGDPCMNPAGKGTDHPGEGPCSIHDNFKNITRRIPGKRYSTGLADSALEMYIQMAEDPEIKSLDDEIALLRMTLTNMQEMIADIRSRHGGKAFHEAYGEKLDPAGHADQKALLALTKDSSKVAESISKLVSQKAKIEEGKIVTYRQVQEVLAQVIYTIKRHCDGCSTLPKLAEDFAGIDVSKFRP